MAEGSPTSVVTVHVGEREADDVAGELWALGTVGIEQGDDTLVAHFPTVEAATAAAVAVGRDAVVGPAPVVDWVAAGRPWLSVTRAGPLVVHPPWVEAGEVDDGDLVVTIDPGPTFGHGGHPTTRLVLEALVGRVTPGFVVLDVGCGSGVLAVAALRLGADHATAIDIDPDAVTRTLANAALNGVATRLTADTRPLASLDARFDVVVANMTAADLTPVLGDIERRSTGVAILSGILDEQAADIVALLSGRVVAVTSSDGWSCLVIASDPPASTS